MILIWLLFVWFGVHGAGAGLVGYMLLLYGGDRLLGRREIRRFDKMPGGYA